VQIFLDRPVAVAALITAAVGLCSCATTAQQERLVHIQADVTALRADVSKLSAQVEELDRLIRPPSPPRVTVGVEGAPVLGDRAAKIAIVEFSDFQCPFCKRFHDATLPMLKERYIDNGKIMMIYRDLPLDFHALAKGAAVAAYCAGAQGHFWEMADALFDGQERLGSAYYNALAARLGLDTDAFKSCLTDPAAEAKVTRDVADAASLGIDGTPAFFIGRVEGDRVIDAEYVSGAQPFPVFARILDSLVK
jgi:protein-disulfide isomerase